MHDNFDLFCFKNIGFLILSLNSNSIDLFLLMLGLHCNGFLLISAINVFICVFVMQKMGLWTILEGFLLLANAMAILNEDRFLAPREFMKLNQENRKLARGCERWECSVQKISG
ncbi:hypothetical protein ERO13_D13G018200v2 [Gossypium hirsutum]|nr:hypothetical protein ERO13_D13G018200v2 [Gossypium hirsutum]